MLRLNVAADAHARGAWVVHLYGGDGDEHIYQLTAVSASNAARCVLEAYETSKRAEAQVSWLSMVVVPLPLDRLPSLA